MGSGLGCRARSSSARPAASPSVSHATATDTEGDTKLKADASPSGMRCIALKPKPMPAKPTSARATSHLRCAHETPSQCRTGSGCSPRACSHALDPSTPTSCTMPRAVTISNVPPPGSSRASLTHAPCSAKSTPDMATIPSARSCSRRRATPPGDTRSSRALLLVPVPVSMLSSSGCSACRVRS